MEDEEESDLEILLVNASTKNPTSLQSTFKIILEIMEVQQ